MKKILFISIAVIIVCVGIGVGINSYHATQRSNSVTQFLYVFYEVPDSSRYEAYNAHLKKIMEESSVEPGVFSFTPKINEFLPIENYFTEPAFIQFCSSILLFYMDQSALKENASISIKSLKTEPTDSEFKYIITVVYTTNYEDGTQKDASHTWDIRTENMEGIEKIVSFRLRGVY